MGAWKRPFVIALAALVLLTGGPAASQVPDFFARDLAEKLARAEVALNEEGYMRAAGPFGGGLAVRTTDRIALTLRAGQDYRIVGVCDDRCALGLRLLDPNEAPIARAAEDAGAIVMRVRPAFTGAHSVEVMALRCQVAACWYAINVYTR